MFYSRHLFFNRQRSFFQRSKTMPELCGNYKCFGLFVYSKVDHTFLHQILTHRDESEGDPPLRPT